ncbi:hypothetical protein EGW08_006519 [Elysia chlorotica]|uniref:Uncharacterized protein n=1 Tax=Elysia chlorotica TaxID=188477 RepID=A0A3S1HTD8_ELYCH|nr:hypothetical protein EGW08_006519 [Elysia chlorotica]
MTATKYNLDDQPGVSRRVKCPSRCAHVWAWRRYILLFATPLLLAPLPVIVDRPEAKCAYVVMLMAVYWFTAAMPVGVTALLPVVLFPTLGIMDTGSTTMLYMKVELFF